MIHAENQRWGHVEELLATIAETLEALFRVTIQANSTKPPDFGPPFRYPRPGQPAETPRGLSRSKVRTALLSKG